MRRAAARLEPSSPTLTESRGSARRSSREQVERIFAVELKRFAADERARRIATIISGEAWDVLRSHDGPAPEQAQVATAEAVRDLLRPPA
jgi:hypothetical protein